METIRCTSCHKNKPKSKFNKGQSYCKACKHVKSADWYERNKRFSNLRSKSHRMLLKREVLTHYSKGKHPACTCCGESCLEFLAVDHKNGGGTKERMRASGMSGVAFYAKLKKAGFPKGYRTLCHNCNASHGYYGYCPHQRREEKTMSGFLKDLERNNSFKRKADFSGEKNPKVILTLSKVKRIRKLWATGSYSQGWLANKYGVSQSAIGSVVHNRSWKV